MGSRTGRAGQRILILALAGVCALPLLRGILAPYVTRADNNTAAFAQPARNYLRHGLLATKLGLTYNTGEPSGARFAYNTHHPPLASLATAAVFVLTGVSDWAARVYPALCSIGSALLLYLIWRRHRGWAPAAAAALTMAALPAFGHFGKMLGEEAPTLFFALLTIEAYQRWKDADAPGKRWLYVIPYAAGCLSGWAAFYAGPLLIADAAVTLRSRPAMRRRAFVSLAGTALVSFALILAHVWLLTGSIEALIDAASNRALGPEQETAAHGTGGLAVWLEREAGYFQRLYGTPALFLLGGGIAAGATSLARRRARAPAVMTVAVLTGVGLAHPLVFPWAAYFHDWLLFHLLPILGVAGAEGLFLLAALGSGGLRWSGAPRPAAAVAGTAMVLGGMTAHTILSVQQAGRLQEESPCYAWPLVGRVAAGVTDGGANLMANFPVLDAPLRFYADRPSSTVRTIEAYEQLFPLRRYELYIRDRHIPIASELERILDRLPCLTLATFDICALSPGSTTAAAVEASAAGREPRHQVQAAIDARFDTVLHLTGHEVDGPATRPAPRPFTARFLGMADQRYLKSRLVRVASDWVVSRPPPSVWHITTAMTIEPPDDAIRVLPEVALPAQRRHSLGPDTGPGLVTVEETFFLPDDAPGSWIHLRWAVDAGGATVRPVLPGPPQPLLKVVVSDPIVLFGKMPPTGVKKPGPKLSISRVCNRSGMADPATREKVR